MITEQRMFLDILGSRKTQYTIPVFQRVYSWNRDQCDELWGDILRAGRTSNTHFIGTLLYSVEPDEGDGIAHLSVIDGQQRTATLTLLLAAFERYLRKTGASIGAVDADFVRESYLFVEGITSWSSRAPTARRCSPCSTAPSCLRAFPSASWTTSSSSAAKPRRRVSDPRSSGRACSSSC